MNMPSNRLSSWIVIVGCVVGLASVFAAPRLITLTDPGDFLIRNTIRLSLVFWFWSMYLRVSAWNIRLQRLTWSLAWLVYVIHVAMAFEHYHHWSHGSAVDHVEGVSGFGRGLFVSYFFTLVWTIDVAVWWLAPDRRGPRWLISAWYGFSVFIVLNGTVIYETGVIRYVGIYMFVYLGSGWCLRRRIVHR